MTDSRIKFGQFAYDIEADCLFRSGRPCDLPPLAGQVLGILIRQRNAIVSKDEICDQLWPAGAVDHDQRIRSLIRDLRAVIGHDPNAPLIETVHRKGYRFNLPDGADDRAAVSLISPYRLVVAGLAVAVLLVGFILFRQSGDTAPVPPPGVSEEVFRDYLRARALMQGGQTGDRERALALFESVTQSAPDFSAAYSGMAHAIGVFGGEPARVRRLVEDALRLDMENVEAYFLRGETRLYLDLDISGGADLERAHRLAPENTLFAAGYAVYLNATDQLDEAGAIARNIDESEILAPRIFTDLGFIFIRNGDTDTAERYCNKALELAGQNPTALNCQLQAALAADNSRRAAELVRQIYEQRFGAPLAAATDSDAATPDQTLETYWADLVRRYHAGKIRAIEGASALAMLGDKEAALAAIRDARARREIGLVFLKVNVFLRSLRGDAEFEAIATEIGLPEASGDI